MLLAPEEFGGGGKLVSTILTFTGLEFSCITGLELRSLERKNNTSRNLQAARSVTVVLTQVVGD